MNRVGIGYDLHRLVSDRKLILGGMEIAFEKGLLGHSDADVLLHAICDAILGAAGLGDIGQHFPDSDPKFKNIDSKILLKNVCDLVSDQFTIQNLDTTIICQRPKLAPHIPKMRKKIAETIGIPIERVNVKATTSEGIGFIGREEGIACQAIVALLEKK